MIAGLVQQGYGPVADVLSLSFEQIEILWSGGKRQKPGFRPVQSLSELESLLAPIDGGA